MQQHLTIPTLTDKDLGRFWSKVQRSDDPDACWQWSGKPTSAGYGRLQIRWTNYLAHRLMYVLTHGEIPEEYVIDHLCRNTMCVNPDHLEAVPNVVNTWKRGHGDRHRAHQRGTCTRGHLINEDNVFVDGGRVRCMRCKMETAARSDHKRRGTPLRTYSDEDIRRISQRYKPMLKDEF